MSNLPIINSIRTKILLITLFFMAFLSAAFVYYSMLTTNEYKKLRFEGIENIVAFEAEKVNKTIAGLEQAARHLAIDGLLFYQSQSLTIAKTSVFENEKSLQDAVGSGYWFEPYAFNKEDLNTYIYAYRDQTSGEVCLYDIDLDLHDFHSLNWYREIADAVTKPYQVEWTRPYIDEFLTGHLMTSAGAGIFAEDGTLLGISTIDWDIDEIIRELITLKPTANSFVLLCVPEKDYVISSTRTNTLVGASLDSIPWDIKADSFVFNGINYLRFGRYIDNGWLLSIQIPEKEIFAEIEKENNTFSKIIALSSIIMLCLAYMLISRLINNPIKQLTYDVAQLARGNLDIRIETRSKDELGLLAEAFNKMTGDLKESIETRAREQVEKERMSVELNVAAKIQASMLPNVFPPFPGRTEFDIYASMLPAKEVGGDFYDFYLIDKNNLAVVIADVSGKGIPAALLMVITKTLMKNCSSCKTPKLVFETVNKKLCENNIENMFVTAFMGFYNIPTGKFVFVNAGHNPPLVRKGEEDYVFLETKPCTVLGFMEDIVYREEEITLEPGDALYLYTDGVTESMTADKELFSAPRLLEVLKKYKTHKPKELLDALKHEIDIFTGGAEQADDITMIGLEITSRDSHSNKTETHDFSIEASIDKLNEVFHFVNVQLQRNNSPPELQNSIDAAVEEVFINIVNYAYSPMKGRVTISISIGKEALIRFEDSGKPYNPLEQAAPDFDKPLMERETGGLGIFLVKQLMDTVAYERRDGKNITAITKKISN